MFLTWSYFFHNHFYCMTNMLSKILYPISALDFGSNYYSKKSLYIGEQPDKFKSLFGWESLNQILNSSPIPHPTMKIVLDGKPITDITDANSIINWCQKGATIIIDQIHKYDRNIGELAANLSREIGEPIQVNMYFSQPSHQAFTRHYDHHDVIILQISGFKGWKVCEATEDTQFPLFVQKHHGLNPPKNPCFECTLAPGDVLYIPRGHWHEATAQVEQSMHLTVGIDARTGIDFLSWLVDELRDDVRWREAFPLVFKEELSGEEPLSPATLNHFDKLRQLLREQISVPSLPYDYHRFCVATARKNNPFTFPFHTLENPVTYGKYKRFVRPQYQESILESHPSTRSVEVLVHGKLYNFSESAEGLLRFIFTSTVFDEEELLKSSPELSWDDILVILNCLVREVIIQPY
jgi:ribosomal protein L16 Arg81 hydroxylase